MAPPPPKIRCRPIGEADFAAVAALLSQGFAGRSPDYWRRGLERQRGRDLPAGCPRYGYLLANEDAVVGVILLLFAAVAAGGATTMRCNLSSWYVEPAFRGYASLLLSLALRDKAVTYVNISPARHTWPTVEAQGFTRYASGQFVAVPALNRTRPGVAVTVVGPGGLATPPAALAEHDLLARHAGFGCLSLMCTEGGEAVPFVLQPYRIRRGRVPLPGMQLIYCRDVADFTRFAGAIGRVLLRRGMPFVVLDANGPVAGLAGRYVEAGKRKYFRGPQAPRLGDLAFTEIVLFGA